MKNLALFAGAQVRNAAFCALVALSLAACDDGSSSTDTPVTGSVTPTLPPPSSAPVAPVTTQKAPVISGQPMMSVNAGAAYRFAPSATDPQGAALTFSIQNKPAWASFSTTTGALTGTPASANAGTYTNIVVSVSDGKMSASLPAYTLTVSQAAVVSATLDWTPPTENSDGTPLVNLAGFKVYYGASAKAMTQVVQVTNPGLSAYTLTNLTSGTWFFAVTSYTTAGIESSLSGVVSTTL